MHWLVMMLGLLVAPVVLVSVLLGLGIAIMWLLRLFIRS
jgi:hypothetical protein